MADFSDIYRRHWPDVLRFSLYLCGNQAEAEDLTAEAFLRAWTSTKPIRAGTVQSYLFVIVRNLHRDRWRSRQNTQPLNDSVHAPRPGPDTTASDRAELDHVLAAMQQLPESDRAILAMAALPTPYDLIAAALDLSLSAVKVRIHRARLKLNTLLAPPGPTP